jgi:hypothetical protein
MADRWAPLSEPSGGLRSPPRLGSLTIPERSTSPSAALAIRRLSSNVSDAFRSLSSNTMLSPYGRMRYASTAVQINSKSFLEVAWPGGHSLFGSVRATTPAVLSPPPCSYLVICRVSSREYLNLRSSMPRESITDMYICLTVLPVSDLRVHNYHYNIKSHSHSHSSLLLGPRWSIY